MRSRPKSAKMPRSRCAPSCIALPRRSSPRGELGPVRQLEARRRCAIREKGEFGVRRQDTGELWRRSPLLGCFLVDFARPSHSIGMFVVTEEDAAAIRDIFDRDGELSAAVELRRRFPLIDDNAIARQWARTIAGWKPLPVMPKPKPRTSGNVPQDQHPSLIVITRAVNTAFTITYAVSV